MLSLSYPNFIYEIGSYQVSLSYVYKSEKNAFEPALFIALQRQMPIINSPKIIYLLKNTKERLDAYSVKYFLHVTIVKDFLDLTEVAPRGIIQAQLVENAFTAAGIVWRRI